MPGKLAIALPYALLLPAIGALSGLWLAGVRLDAVIGATGAVIFMAILGRQYLTLRENQRLTTELEASRSSEIAANEVLLEAQRVAQVGSWEYDLQNDEYKLSPGVFRICGLDQNTFHPHLKTFLAIVPEEERFKLLALLQSLYRYPRSVMADHRILRPDGRVRWVHNRAEPEVNENGTIVRLYGIIHDITDRIEAEEARVQTQMQAQELGRLRELDRLRGDFINRAAHELRTPLTPLWAIVGVLRHKKKSKGATTIEQHTVDLLDRNVLRMSRLVEDLIMAARAQSAKLVLARTPTDVIQLVQASVDSHRNSAAAQGKTIHFEPGPPLTIAIDGPRVQQVFDNLLNNAIKYTNEGGRIDIEIDVKPASVTISVHDDGVGMTEDQRARLFRPFVRAHETLSPARSGTGLGLYISRTLVELHGGTIDCRSPGPGLGSTFRFTLPFPPPEPATALVPAQA